jgi:hypothetical protein
LHNHDIDAVVVQTRGVVGEPMSSTVVERLAAKAHKETWAEPADSDVVRRYYQMQARWWLEAIAAELDWADGDHHDTIVYLQAQAEEGK